MLIISDNLNMARRHIAKAIVERDAGTVRELAHKITLAGADVIDVNLGLVTQGAEETMAWLVEQIQEVSDLQLSLDGHSADAMIAGAEKARKKPILNTYFVHSSHPDSMDRLMEYAARNGLELILPALDAGGPPLDPDERAGRAQELVNAAMSAGVPAEDIFVDPVVVHLAGGDGQAHAAAVLETMKLLATIFDPPVKTLAGVEYLSQGSPVELRSAVSRVYLAMLGALGLNAALVDALDRETMRDIRLIKGLRNESLYSASDAQLK
ncbi:MAG: dihydropteroate synthase [Thermoleophilia bacterium]|nr:dihydropteroate synthase [Thermoleophilia bacterium]